ncbi:hypothetical protein [Myxococcus fulvus]|uniref:hypothetical protein n=1 Tax=Myxococcus fulvus TaxID=33 RepID=UPI0020BEBFAA|nr:hypothetical protein [Myxococcus fulvus]MCK8504203.1 hypothetical protein [Myxococcus fulvus]
MAKIPINVEFFTRLAIHGPRFDQHLVYEGDENTQLLDVDVLPDLKTYRDLIVTIAKALHLKRTKKSRVRPHFESEFQLNLFKTRPGSAAPELVRTYRSPQKGRPHQLRLVQEQDDFDNARDLLEYAVQHLHDYNTLPEEFPREALEKLASFGSGLGDADVIELAPYKKERNKRAPYDKLLRERVKSLAERREYVRVNEVGDFHGAQFSPKRELKVSTIALGTVKVPFTSMTEPLIADLVRDRRFTRIRVDGMAYVSARNGVEEFNGFPLLTIEPDLDPALIKAMDARLKELAELEAGWLDGEGLPLSKPGLNWLRGILLGAMAHNSLPMPMLTPMEEGGVSASWHRRPWYVTADFNLSSKGAYLHAANVVEKDIREMELPFVPEEDSALARLAAFVKECMPDQEGAPA